LQTFDLRSVQGEAEETEEEDEADPDNLDPPPPVTFREAYQWAEGLGRFLQEHPTVFDSESQCRFQINYLARVNRVMVESMTARRQSQIGDFFQSMGGASSSRAREMSAEASDMDE